MLKCKRVCTVCLLLAFALWIACKGKSFKDTGQDVQPMMLRGQDTGRASGTDNEQSIVGKSDPAEASSPSLGACYEVLNMPDISSLRTIWCDDKLLNNDSHDCTDENVPVCLLQKKILRIRNTCTACPELENKSMVNNSNTGTQDQDNSNPNLLYILIPLILVIVIGIAVGICRKRHCRRPEPSGEPMEMQGLQRAVS
ncbi:uncharacterized protein LOC114792877 isoform X2 [Denticeps clupeoides]|uniref:uncharacterized protein LOC114792877 isoform X2 n=1 Tax=Denticeps clupeoides TaxID=299321 RepID=UPI0010A2C442|nr:uncharacterized protein LOC114792877 isoform X2 [Denticeps clupeoides]